jgi:hypothetical protein
MDTAASIVTIGKKISDDWWFTCKHVSMSLYEVTNEIEEFIDGSCFTFFYWNIRKTIDIGELVGNVNNMLN